MPRKGRRRGSKGRAAAPPPMRPPATKVAAGAPHPHHRTVSTVEGVAFLIAPPLVTGAAIAKLLADTRDVAIKNVALRFCTELNMLPPSTGISPGDVRSNYSLDPAPFNCANPPDEWSS